MTANEQTNNSSILLLSALRWFTHVGAFRFVYTIFKSLLNNNWFFCSLLKHVVEV